MTDEEAIAWAVGIWREMPHELRTNQKWRDLVAAARSLIDIAANTAARSASPTRKRCEPRHLPPRHHRSLLPHLQGVRP